MTKRELTDNILTILRQTYKDRWMSRRFILNVYNNNIKELILKALRDRSLYRETDLYTTIDCYEFEEIDSKSCDIIEFRLCNSIMKGKEKLPDLLHTRYGDSVKSINNLNYSEQIEKTTPSKYLRDKKRRSYEEKPYFYIKDGYPYLVNTKMEAGVIELLTLDLEGVENASSCNVKDECKSSLDYDIKTVDKMEKAAYQMTLQELMQSYLNIPADENTNNNQNQLSTAHN